MTSSSSTTSAADSVAPGLSAPLEGRVLAASRSGAHTFSNPTLARIRLLAGLGVEGDAHMGDVQPGDTIGVEFPRRPYRALVPV
jgi:hypothetical protein